MASSERRPDWRVEGFVFGSASFVFRLSSFVLSGLGLDDKIP